MGKTSSSLIRLFAGAACMAGLLAADSSSVDSPLIGYVVRVAGQSSQTPDLRAMWGVPGAARFSDALPLPKGTHFAEAAPGLAWILCIRTSGPAAYEPGSLTLTSLPVSGMPSSWAFSPGERGALHLLLPIEAKWRWSAGCRANSGVGGDGQGGAVRFDSRPRDNGGFVYT